MSTTSKFYRRVIRICVIRDFAVLVILFTYINIEMVLKILFFIVSCINIILYTSFISCASVSDLELRHVTEELYTMNSYLSEYIFINYQKKTTKNFIDNAPKPLFNVSHEAFTHPTVVTILQLFDNYELNVRHTEYANMVKQAEEEKFIRSLLKTDIILFTMNFLSRKNFFANDQQTYFNVLKSIWMELYSRNRQINGSCGFEHVFLAEKKRKNLIGFHNWIFFAIEETFNKLNYLGFGKTINIGNKIAISQLYFKYKGMYKVSTIFIGTTPELEIAVYTLCFFTRPNQKCSVFFAEIKFNIQTFLWQSTNKIATAYPLL